MDHLEESLHEICHDAVRAGRLLRQPARHFPDRRRRPGDRRPSRRRRASRAEAYRGEQKEAKPKTKDAETNGQPKGRRQSQKTMPRRRRGRQKADDEGRREADEEEARREKEERKTAKVETKRVRVVVTLDGTFTAEKMTPVALRPEEWSQFEIVEIVEHGTEVHAGQTLVKFDREKFDEELADLELQLHVSELAIRKAEEELPRLEKTLAMAATEAERNDKNVREDYDRFHKIDRPMICSSRSSTRSRAPSSSSTTSRMNSTSWRKCTKPTTSRRTPKKSSSSGRGTQVDFAKFNLEQTKQFCDEIAQNPPAAIRHRHQGIARQGGARPGASEDGAGARHQSRPLRTRTTEARRGPRRSIGTPNCSPTGR